MTIPQQKKRKREQVVDVESLKAAYKSAKALAQASPEDETLKTAYKAAKKSWKNAVASTGESQPENAKKQKVEEVPSVQASDKKESKKLVVDLPVVSEAEVQAYREKNLMTVEGNSANGEIFPPLFTFELAKAAFCSFLGKGDTAKLFQSCEGFDKPTPIQAQCWSVALRGRDLIGIAETGSGKTLGFLMPAVSRMMTKAKTSPKKPCKGAAHPRMLVLSPTRELAMQIHEVAVIVGAACGFRAVVVYGGVAKQGKELRANGGADIVVATPGRLLDLAQNDGDPVRGSIVLSDVQELVLDEADRMLDMGFEHDVRAIISFCPSVHDRSAQFFSATWPPTIRKLASEFLNPNSVRVTIGDDELSVNQRVQQIVEVVEPRDKDKRLLNLLQKYHSDRKNRVLIFVLYKKEASRVEGFLQQRGWKCCAIHGDKSQDNRTSALAGFKDGSCPLLIATDVAARGLDIPDVSHVLNYSFPLTIEDYIHRIGRTGRAGKHGISHTLFTKDDKGKTGALVNVLREANQPVPEALMAFGCFVKKKEHGMYGAHFKDVDMTKKATKVVLD